MILSNIDILRSLFEDGGIRIDPFDEKCVQPASYDLHLGNTFMFLDGRFNDALDPKEDNSNEWITSSGWEYFKVMPHSFALGVTVERVTVPLTMSGRLDGKSSLARMGLSIHSTGGNIDPGNSLRITLELFNATHRPIILHPGMPIAQIVFQKLLTPCVDGYKGKYLNDNGVRASQMHLNFKPAL